MDFKIELLCEKCSCATELRPKHFKPRSSMECPNCGQAFPDDVYESLKNAVHALGCISDSVRNQYGKITFSLKVREINCDSDDMPF